MLKKQLRSLLYYFRSIIHIIVCLQLVLYPAWSFSADGSDSTNQDSASGNGHLKKHINNAIDFNAQAESLFEKAFGAQESSEYYRNHPLDIYSLIGQEVRPYNPKLESIVRRAENRGYSREVIEHLITQMEEEDKSTDETEENKEEKKKDRQATKESKFFGKIKAKLAKSKPYPGRIESDQLLIEVLDSEGNVRAILSSRGEEVRSRIPTKERQDLYVGSSYVTEDEAKYRFRLKYHNQVLHTFLNHISWISAFEGYLVFMEPSQVYERGKALVSFIDLNFFQSALNRTRLPVFQIPATDRYRRKKIYSITPYSH